MKITAKVVPYSSVVGSSVTLHAESGMTICQLSLLSVIPPNFTFTPELHKETSIRVAEWVASALNNAPAYETEPCSGQNLADAHSKSPAPSSQSERIAVLEAALREKDEALTDCVDTLALVERPAFVDPRYGAEVAALGKRIGFGALMASASASWRQALADRGDPCGGEFVAGPCHATVVASLRRARSALAPLGEE